MKRVAILVQTQRGYGRAVLAGVLSFLRPERRWSIFHDDRQNWQRLPNWLTHWKGDGVLGSLESPALLRFVADAGLPAIDLHGGLHSPTIPTFPTVRSDAEAAVRCAYQHIQQLGYPNLAYCGYKRVSYSEEREAITIRLAQDDQRALAVYEGQAGAVTSYSQMEANALGDEARLGKWLVGLPRPVGVIACNDARGAQVINVASRLGLRIPFELAVVGMDNDSLVCETCNPPLSSVDLNAHQVGYRAAELLDRWMCNPSAGPPGSQLVAALGVVQRTSTDLAKQDDPIVADALKYITEHITSPIDVASVADYLGVSRSTLERHFRTKLRCPVKEQIDVIRISVIKSALAASDKPIGALADELGYAHKETMTRLFKSYTGMSPAAYRRAHKLGGA